MTRPGMNDTALPTADGRVEVAALLHTLETAATHEDSEAWLAALSDRKRKESEFHDWCRVPADEAVAREEWTESHGNKKYYDTRGSSWEFTQQWIRDNARDRVFLDYCCGEGGSTLLGAAAGAKLAIGIDISPKSVELCRAKARDEGYSATTRFLVGDAEHTGLPDNSIDRIVALGVLHHLDLTYAFPEIRRILKPGGRLYAMEALAYNPVIAMYRCFTPELRTEWERHHILSLRELRFARHFFDVENVRYHHLASILATPLRRTPIFNSVLSIANAIDSVLLRIPPFLLLAWSFSFELVKRPSDFG